MPGRATSRKRKQDETSEDASTDMQYSLFVGWLDEGVGGKDGDIEHEGFTLTIGGKTFDISIGDAVLMRTSKDQNSQVETSQGMIARVERIWETKNSGSGECPFMFQARWFLRVRRCRFWWVCSVFSYTRRAYSFVLVEIGSTGTAR
jgi:hypothetical protein